MVSLLPYSVFADDLMDINPESTTSSEHKFQSVVPSLIGLTLPEVLQLLPQYDLSLGVVTEIMDTNADSANKVITQSIAANSEVKRLSAIDISVAIANPASVIPKSMQQEEEQTSGDKLNQEETTPVNTRTETLEKPVETAIKIIDKSKENENKEILKLPAKPEGETKETVTLPITSDDELPIEITHDDDKTPFTTKETQTAVKKAEIEKTGTEPLKQKEVAKTLSTAVDIEKEADKKTNTTTENAQIDPISIPDAKPIAVTSTTSESSDKVIENTDSENTVTEKEADPIAVTSTTSESNDKAIVNIDSANKPIETEESTDKLENTTRDTSDTATIESSQQDTQQKDKTVTPTTSTATRTPATTSKHNYKGAKVSVSISPSEVQLTREITMEIHIDPLLESNQWVYQFNLSGKTYTRKSPVFTHVFEEEGKAIITGSARILGNPWIHSSSQRISIGKYVAKKIKVPNIVGLSEQEAAALLKSKGLLVGNIQEKIVKGGKDIIKQMPAAGSIRSEDDNKIHYVKAIDEKFKISVIAPTSTGLDTAKATTISAQLSPKAKKVRYRFLVNGTPYFSNSSQLKHTFARVGTNTVVAEAIIAGEGTFVSPPISFSVADAWHLPKAVISPFTVNVEQGESVTFKSASSYDRRGGLTVSWQDAQGRSLNQTSLLVNTKDLKEGEHIVKLRIKDEKGHEAIATAQLIVTAAKEDSAANAETTANSENSSNDTRKTEDSQAVTSTANSTDSSSNTGKIEDTNVLVEQEVDAALAALESDNETEQQRAIAAVKKQEAALIQAAEDAKRLALMNNAAQLEQSLNNEPTEVIEAIVPTAGAVTPIIPIQDITVKSQRIVAESSNNTAKMTVNIGIWLLSIIIILVAIFWVLRKSIKHSDKEQVETDMKAEIPASPYNKSAPTTASHTRRASTRKTKVDPSLVDFDLGKQSKHPNSKKKDLTDFKLDDD
jgi:beta-lactam-binding protein with PASTA domain